MKDKRRRIPKRATATARKLRRNSTPPERVLWGMLRDRRLDGLKFRRQVAVADFVVDFLCAEAGLVVELDGLSHVGTGKEDEERTRRIEEEGYRDIRVTNHDLAADPDAVAQYILIEAHRAGPHPHPSPLPEREREPEVHRSTFTVRS